MTGLGDDSWLGVPAFKVGDTGSQHDLVSPAQASGNGLPFPDRTYTYVKFLIGTQRDSIACKALALYMTDSGLLPRTMHDPSARPGMISECRARRTS